MSKVETETEAEARKKVAALIDSVVEMTESDSQWAMLGISVGRLMGDGHVVVQGRVAVDRRMIPEVQERLSGLLLREFRGGRGRNAQEGQ